MRRFRIPYLGLKIPPADTAPCPLHDSCQRHRSNRDTSTKPSQPQQCIVKTNAGMPNSPHVVASAEGKGRQEL